MKFPDRLDYDETEIAQSDDDVNDYGREWYPLVFCKVDGCDWTYHATWDELGNDSYGAGWDTLHPAHGPLPDRI